MSEESLERTIAAVRVEERERAAALVEKFWTFDNNQQHTHTWHCKQDCLDAIREPVKETDDA